MNNESEYPKTIVTRKLGNKADTQRPKHGQGDVLGEMYMFKYVSMSPKSSRWIGSMKSKGGNNADKNLLLVHLHCHDKIHSSKADVTS